MMKPLRSRFQKDPVKSVQDYTESISYDRRLYRQDIVGSIAHARALAEAGILAWEETEAIVTGLMEIREEIGRGDFKFDEELEDIHMNIEARLFEKIGDIAGKLHTARSRNDQVATDLKFFIKDAISETVVGIRALQGVLVDLAETHQEVAVPGYTHLQRAQPILLAHYLLAYFEMLQRDVERFNSAAQHADVLPLGSGALAGVAYPINRRMVAHELGFREITANSLDAVSDRDFVIEYQATASITMMHLSRLAEELILWSSVEFGFIEIDDAYTTTSSIMPQKKNPDVAELARGKTGRVYGNLMAILTTMKGLPLAYNRDLQEDKEGLFDTVDTLTSTLEVFTGMLKTLTVDVERLSQSAEGNYSLATDVADYLVSKGMPFREAHGVVARLVSHAIGEGKSLKELSLDEYRRFSDLFAEDVHAITVKSSIAARNVHGGTSPKQVQRALKRARRILDE